MRLETVCLLLYALKVIAYGRCCRNVSQDDVVDFKNIPVDKDTTADEVLQRVLRKLGDEVSRT